MYANITSTMNNSSSFNNTSTLYPSTLSSTPSQQPLWNFSSSTSTRSSPSSAPPSTDVVVSPNVPYMAAELVIAILSTVGNLMVCAAVALNRKLRTVTNYFLVSLAVADICVGALAIPCAILTGVGVPRHDL